MEKREEGKKTINCIVYLLSFFFEHLDLTLLEGITFTLWLPAIRGSAKNYETTRTKDQKSDPNFI